MFVWRPAVAVLGAVLAAGLAFTTAAATTCPGAWISVNQTGARAGAGITGSGPNWSAAAGASPVTIHLDGAAGQVLWSGLPNAAGNISFQFTVPNLAAGYHSVVAVQTVDGKAVVGSPAWSTFEVLAPAAAPAATRPRSAPAPMRQSAPTTVFTRPIIAAPAAPAVIAPLRHSPAAVAQLPAQRAALAPRLAPGPIPQPAAAASPLRQSVVRPAAVPAAEPAGFTSFLPVAAAALLLLVAVAARLLLAGRVAAPRPLRARFQTGS